MNLIASIFVFLFSFLSNSADPSFENVQGVWKGYYGTEYEIKEITIRIKLQNKAEIFDGNTDANNKMNGTYLLPGNSTIIISSSNPNSNSAEIVLNGILNPTSSFISGDWDGHDAERGCFYLQKQPKN